MRNTSFDVAAQTRAAGELHVNVRYLVPAPTNSSIGGPQAAAAGASLPLGSDRPALGDWL